MFETEDTENVSIADYPEGLLGLFFYSNCSQVNSKVN